MTIAAEKMRRDERAACGLSAAETINAGAARGRAAARGFATEYAKILRDSSRIPRARIPAFRQI
jgi:hypothetical protein